MSESAKKTPAVEPVTDAAKKPAKRNQLVMGVIAGVIFLIAVGLGYNRFGPVAQAASTEVWYFDLGSNQLFSHMEQVPPIDAPSGPYNGGKGGVLAAVYSCGDCKDEAKRFVAWMVTCKPESREQVERHIVPPVI